MDTSIDVDLMCLRSISTFSYNGDPCARTPMQTLPPPEYEPLEEQSIAFDEHPESLMIQYPDQQIQTQVPCKADLERNQVYRCPILQKKLKIF